MDGGDCAESGARGKDCGKSHCHNNTIIFHPVYIMNKTYASDMFVVGISGFVISLADLRPPIPTTAVCEHTTGVTGYYWALLCTQSGFQH